MQKYFPSLLSGVFFFVTTINAYPLCPISIQDSRYFPGWVGPGWVDGSSTGTQTERSTNQVWSSTWMGSILPHCPKQLQIKLPFRILVENLNSGRDLETCVQYKLSSYRYSFCYCRSHTPTYTKHQRRRLHQLINLINALAEDQRADALLRTWNCDKTESPSLFAWLLHVFLIWALSEAAFTSGRPAQSCVAHVPTPFGRMGKCKIPYFWASSIESLLKISRVASHYLSRDNTEMNTAAYYLWDVGFEFHRLYLVSNFGLDLDRYYHRLTVESTTVSIFVDDIRITTLRERNELQPLSSSGSRSVMIAYQNSKFLSRRYCGPRPFKRPGVNDSISRRDGRGNRPCIRLCTPYLPRHTNEHQ